MSLISAYARTASRAAMAAVLVAAACRSPRVGPPTPRDAACTAWPASATLPDSTAIVLTWPIDPVNVTRPSNPAERFVVAQAYESLMTSDCLGRPLPALARTWTVATGATRVQLVLRDSARFWSGETVTSRDVIASWSATGRDPSALLARRMAERATIVDDLTLEIECDVHREPVAPTSGCGVLSVLADPELVVAKRAATGRWPVGTGAYRAIEGTPSTPTRRPTLVLEPSHGSSRRHLTIHATGPADARDLVDAGVGLLLTDDPALATYAAARPDLTALPQPWDRTWALIMPRRRQAPPGSVSATNDPDTIAARTVEFRAALARDAVRADARVAERPAWWRGLESCVPLSGTIRESSNGANARIASRTDQPIARSIAERLVALAVRPSAGQDSALSLLAPEVRAAGSRATAIALAPNDFAVGLRTGIELAYIVSMPRRSDTPCVDAERLRSGAPWLLDDPSSLATSTRIHPLVETRLLAVVRRDWLGLTMTADSTLVISSR